MRPVLELFWSLCTFRSGPERMPTASLFVILVVASNLLVSMGVALSAPGIRSFMAAVSLPVVMAAVLAVTVWTALQIRGVPARFTATFTALMGADAMITAMQWPLLVLAGTPEAPPAAGIATLLFLATLGLFAWWIAILGFVLSRALMVGRAQATALAILFTLMSMLVSSPFTAPEVT
ncbi:MAG: hypothetical protein V2I63_09085 [Pseudomonadales bacterium]|jgi:hypothetical protein|nr:hypothetical protein [Pseudomonadales bacterium]